MIVGLALLSYGFVCGCIAGVGVGFIWSDLTW